MIEHYILKLFLSKQVFTKYYKCLDVEFIRKNYKELYRLFKAIEDFHSKYKMIEHATVGEIEAHYLSIYPVIKEGDRTLLSSLLHKIDSLEITDAALNYLNTHRDRSIAGDLAMCALDVAEGKRSKQDLVDIYAKFESTSASDAGSAYITDDLEELYDHQCKERGLRWRLQFLNRSLGSLRQGDFGFVFARPETGKTTFLASEITAFAAQTERNVLWCNNEESGNKVKLRCYQAALGVTHQELFANLKQNQEIYRDIIGDRIKIYDDAGMSMSSIEAHCKELNPALIVLDQIDKVKGVKDDRYDLQMKEVYQWARELAKKYGAVIGVCQAGGTAEGKRWLTMNDVDSSHTAKQGEADWILGIGKSHDEGMGNIRFLNISKNKLIGDDDTLSELRHGKAEVVIKPEIARYEDLN